MLTTCSSMILSLHIILGLSSAAGPMRDSVQEIMAKVAENQDRAQEIRSAFVYNQTLLLRFKRGNGKLAREELREYTVTPTSTGTNKQLSNFRGVYENKGNLVKYEEPGHKYKDLDIDGELIDELAKELANEKKSRDGVTMELFPLTSKQQRKYRFVLKGKEDYRGKEVYRIDFSPRKDGWGLIDDDKEPRIPWSGEILVDAREHQAVLVTTRLAKGVPFLIQTLLGTNVKNLAFKLAYERFDEGVWFPVNYGCEFELRAVFLYKRKVALALSNRGFQRAEVAARVSFDDPLFPEQPLKIDRVLRLRELSPQPEFTHHKR